MEFLLIADLVVPATIGLALRRWSALAVVLVLWIGLLVFAAAEWGLDSDDVPAEGLLLGAFVGILIPAEAVAALGVVIGRAVWPPR